VNCTFPPSTIGSYADIIVPVPSDDSIIIEGPVTEFSENAVAVQENKTIKKNVTYFIYFILTFLKVLI
jgi:hypothetical protein